MVLLTHSLHYWNDNKSLNFYHIQVLVCQTQALTSRQHHGNATIRLQFMQYSCFVFNCFNAKLGKTRRKNQFCTFIYTVIWVTAWCPQGHKRIKSNKQVLLKWTFCCNTPNGGGSNITFITLIDWYIFLEIVSLTCRIMTNPSTMSFSANLWWLGWNTDGFQC